MNRIKHPPTNAEAASQTTAQTMIRKLLKCGSDAATVRPATTSLVQKRMGYMNGFTMGMGIIDKTEAWKKRVI